MVEIFVFGSNQAGRHGKGAALAAKLEHGAIYGQGFGLQGRSYGIPTKDSNLKTLPLDMVEWYVLRFISFAKTKPDWTFNVTAIGCGLAGYTPRDIAPFFKTAPSNCILPREFNEQLQQEEVR